MSDPREVFYVHMFQAWKRGISPREFRKCLKKDIEMMVGMDIAYEEKAYRQSKINEMMAKMR